VRLTRPCICLPLLVAAALFAADARADDPPRHKPRVTNSSDATSTDDSSSTPAKKRKHANSLDDDASANTTPPEDDSPPPKKKSVTSDSTSDDDSPPPPKKKRTSDDEDTPRERRTNRADDSSELRDEADHGKPHKRTRTAEEELVEQTKEEESLSKLDEQGNGLAFELLTGPFFLSNAASGVTTRGGFGMTFSWQLGRLLFAPEWEFLHQNLVLEVSYLYADQYDGTDEVKVGSKIHYLDLAVLFGYPINSSFLVYAKFGPALFVTPISYDVDGTVTPFSGVKGGFVYGLGL
jgi:hypothetical protein